MIYRRYISPDRTMVSEIHQKGDQYGVSWSNEPPTCAYNHGEIENFIKHLNYNGWTLDETWEVEQLLKEYET
jgi:hypothetical protein